MSVLDTATKELSLRKKLLILIRTVLFWAYILLKLSTEKFPLTAVKFKITQLIHLKIEKIELFHLLLYLTKVLTQYFLPLHQ